MADDFKTYNRTPILSLFNTNRCNFGRKKIVLVIITASLVILLLAFVGLLGRAESELATGKSASASAVLDSQYCTSTSCMKTAARILELMNRSVDPCENFYQYACGNYKVVKPVLVDVGRRSVLTDMASENEERIIDVLEKPISQRHDYSSERKLKEFFQSCNDMYVRESNRGTPFLTKVVPALGGWKLLGTLDPNWDFNTALKKVHADFWVDAIYSPWVGPDWYDHTENSIEILSGGMGKYLYWILYTDPYSEQIRKDYKKFIRRVGTLLLRDAKEAQLINGTVREEVLEEFVNDTFTFESSLAAIKISAEYMDDPYDEPRKITLANLTALTNGVIDWEDQMTYIFNTAGVTGSTKVVVFSLEYLQAVTSMIESLPDVDRNRILSNYLIWRVADVYSQDLSWEYIHANRELHLDMFGSQDFSGLYRYCFNLAENYMSDALSALFIREHFVGESKITVTDITSNIKLALQTQLDKTPWMDEKTKKYAKEKLDHVTFKMGHPDWMANQAYVDHLYNGLTVNVSDFFGNVLSATQLSRADWNERLLATDEDREEWDYPTYSTLVGLFFFWNEIIAPAGILQFPVYHKDQPHHSTFGSLGTILGRFLHHIVDEWGKYFDKNGDYIGPESWWSNSSLEAYKPIRECVKDVYTNVTRNVVYPDGTTRSVRINARRYTPIAISWTNGIRLAKIGYKDWLKTQKLEERTLPGVELTNEQMIFLAHAQTFCFARGSKESYAYTFESQVEKDIQVNMALGQLEEFSDAFHCPAESKMNHFKKCDYY